MQYKNHLVLLQKSGLVQEWGKDPDLSETTATALQKSGLAVLFIIVKQTNNPE